MQVLLTCDRIKCSLGMLFIIVNYQYGTRGPATIRDRSADHWWGFRWLLRGCGGADSGGATVVAGIAPHHTVFVRSFLVPNRTGVCRAGLSVYRWAQRPRHLGSGPGRRVQL